MTFNIIFLLEKNIQKLIEVKEEKFLVANDNKFANCSIQV